ncbi:hypothetical protein ACKWTF_005943 [Chironomus riparius]
MDDKEALTVSYSLSINEDLSKSDDNSNVFSRSISLRSYNKWLPAEHGVTLGMSFTKNGHCRINPWFTIPLLCSLKYPQNHLKTNKCDPEVLQNHLNRSTSLIFRMSWLQI